MQGSGGGIGSLPVWLEELDSRVNPDSAPIGY